MKRLVPVLVSLCMFFAVSVAHAADFFISPESGNVYVGQQFDVTLRARTGVDESLNAIEAKINFPKNLLEVVSVSRATSALNLLLKDPSFSNQTGVIDVIGGVSGGISGSSLEMLKISFRAKAVGTAVVTLPKDDSKIYANDGLGTNILLNIVPGTYTITPAPPPPPPGVPPPPPPPPAPIIPPPIQIVRPVIPAVGLPELPKLAVVLYPDSTVWYNRVSPFLAQWELPDTIASVATALDRNPSTEPPKTEGLFENKIFPSLEDGTNYLHVQFRNTKGKSPVAHYRLAIDTSPPLPVDISVKEGNITDNPQPTVSYVSGDYISGIDHYEVTIIGKDPIITNDTSVKLPLLPPGKHKLRVRAFDRAGNFAEGRTDLEITPIAAPEITYIAKDAFVGETSIPIKGTALKGAGIIIFVKKDTGETVFSDTTKTSEDGLWQAILTPQLMKGNYYAEVRAQDERGALSLPVQSTTLIIRERPAFVIGKLEVSQFWLFTGLIFVLVSSFLSGFFFYKTHTRAHEKRIAEKIIIAERDMHGSFSTIDNAIEKVSDALKDDEVDAKEVTDLKFVVNKLKDNLKKSEEYLGDEIDEIKD